MRTIFSLIILIALVGSQASLQVNAHQALPVPAERESAFPSERPAPAEAQAPTALITLDIRDLDTTGSITNFTYLINEDNTGDPTHPDPLMHPSLHPMASYSPIVAAGDANSAAVDLPDGRYFISVRAPGYKLWGKHLRLPDDLTNGKAPGGVVTIELRLEPLPLSQMVVWVFNDRAPSNGFPGLPTLEAGLEGFHIHIDDAVGEVTVDWFGNPLCSEYYPPGADPDGPGGEPALGTHPYDPTLGVDTAGNPVTIPESGGSCITDATGHVTIKYLGYGRYDMHAIPPEPNLDASGNPKWVQLTTFEGTQAIDAWLEEGSDGRGAIGEILIEPGAETAYFFGFVPYCDWGDTTDQCPDNDDRGGGTGTIMGTARNWIAFPPFEQLTFGEPVYKPWIALNDIGNTDTQMVRVQGNADGSFVINNVPAGTYQLVIWDEPLDYIMRFVTVNVTEGGTTNMGDVGVFRWWGWLSGYIFMDDGLDSHGNPIGIAGNGIRECSNPADISTCERGIPNLGVGTPFRDGSQYQGAVTDSTGYYEFPEIRGPLGKMVTAEVDFGRFAVTGHSVHDEQYSLFNLRDPSPTLISPDLGGGIILSALLWEGRRSTVDFGKLPYAPGENGGISGRVLYATTRNEFDARLAAAEDYEPGIPGVTVRLYGLGADGLPNTPDDVPLNEVQTDAWQHPSMYNLDNQVSCDVRDKDGNPIVSAVTTLIAERCIEVPQTGNEIKPGAYDGGWAFGDICPAGTFPCTDDQLISPIPPGDYVVEVVPPPFYQILREEDNNTGEGDDLQPMFPPPPCVGDLHTVPPTDYDGAPGFPTGEDRPLCNKRLVTLQDQQNAGLDIFLFTTDQPYVVNDPTSSWTSAEAVPPPARFFGLVEDDITLNTNPNSITYGEKRGVPNLPIGLYDYAGRLLTTVYTDENGFYEVMVPSTFTASCPTPGGVCPGMIVMVLNDPGSPIAPNPEFRNDYLTEPLAFEVFPGKMRHTDTPVDPINPLVCSLPPGPGQLGAQGPFRVPTPQIFAVSQPYVSAGSLPFNLTITGTRMGADPYNPDPLDPPAVTLDDDDGVADPFTLPVASWTPADPFNPTTPVYEEVVEVTIPGGTPPGMYQLMVENAAGGRTSVNGLTFHILGGSYNPPVVPVSPPVDLYDTPIQDAINAAAPGSLIVIQPGTYQENIILHKNVKLQGYGPGGAVGAPPAFEPDPPPEPPDPDDPPQTVGGEEPFAHILGTVIDGRFWQFVGTNRTAWETLIGSLSFGGPTPVPGGAGITVVADPGEFSAVFRPQIDGLGITASRGHAGGGIYVHAYGSNLLITNNILESNTGAHGGAISLGRPQILDGMADNANDNIIIHHNRILGNGGVNFAGAVGIFNGADNYQFYQNDVCGNQSLEYGAGLSHFGLSNGGSIHDNRIYFNDAYDEGGGILIGGDPFTSLLGLGSGDVSIEANLIEANLSNDDGGGIMLLQPLDYTVQISNNIVVGNVAADFGGGIHLDNASAAVIVNNTIANNKSTSTAVDRDMTPACIPADGFSCPHAAGLTSTPYGNGFDPGDGTTYSDPVLFNNIFWNNESFYWGTLPPEPGLPPDPDLDGVVGLVSAGLWDMEVVYPTSPGSCLSPTYSLLSVAYGPDAGSCTTTHASNIVGADPLFVNTQPIDVSAAPHRQDLSEIFIQIVRPEGTLVGYSDYHLTTGSPAINAGAALDPLGSGVTAPNDDYDHDARPQGAGFDIGADELQATTLLYFSLDATGTATGASTSVTAADEDILAFDGFDFAMFFDGSAAGLPAGADIDAFSVLANGTILISFDAPLPAGTLPGIPAGFGPIDDSDIVSYASGSWAVYFDGSDVGLTLDGLVFDEDIDAFELLPTGQLLVSTAAGYSVGSFPSIITGGPQDLLMCTGSLGTATTTCSWTVYFDGDDVDLGTFTSNLDGASVDSGGDIYLSTTSAVTVTGVSADDEDVFVCAEPETGPATECIYNPTLYFDGSLYGLGPSDLDAIDVPLPITSLLGPIAGLAATTIEKAPPGEMITMAAALASGKNVIYTWDFGDGSPAYTAPAISNGGSVVEHVYAQRGDYIITVTATNARGSLQATTRLHVGYEIYAPLVQQ